MMSSACALPSSPVKPVSDPERLKPAVVVNLSTGIEQDPERMMLGLFTAESALAAGKRVLIFLSLESVRAVTPGGMSGVLPCEGCPSLEKLYKQVVRAGVEIFVCPMCLNARHINPDSLVEPAVAAGTARMMEWIGEPDASVFSF